MSENSPKKTLLPIAIIVLGLCILGGSAFFFFATRPNEQAVQQFNTNDSSIAPSKSVNASEVLYSIAAEVNKDLAKDDQGKISSDGEFLWEDKEGYLFNIKDSTSVQFRMLVQNNRSWTSEEIAKQALNKTVIDIFDKKMSELGFLPNSINTSNSIEDSSLGGYQKAYTKGDVVCLFAGDNESTQEENGLVNIVSSENYKSYVGSSVNCKDSLKGDIESIKPILEDLEIKGSWINLDNPNISTLENEDFLTFGVGSYPRSFGGYKVIAKKEGGKFRKIYEGQSSIPCDVVAKEKVPVYIAECEPEEDAARALYE